MKIEHEVREASSILGNFSFNLSSIEVDPTNQIAALGSRSGKIVLFDLTQQKSIQILPGHTAAVTDLEFNRLGSFLISGSYDRSIRLWNLNEMQDPPVVIQDHDSWVSSVAFDQKENYFYSGAFEGVQKRFSMSNMDLSQGLCALIDRNITEKEWQEYVADDIEIEKTCNDK